MNYIYLIAFGNLEESIMERLKEMLSGYLDVPVRILSPQPIPEHAYLERRGQYDASLILEEVSRWLPADGLRILGLTEVDLCTLVLTYVFGVAEVNPVRKSTNQGGNDDYSSHDDIMKLSNGVNRAGLVSLTRLRPEFYKLPSNQNLLLERITKELLHELGHTFGLVHCSQPQCLMSRSATIAQIDTKTLKFCPRCSEIIHGK